MNADIHVGASPTYEIRACRPAACPRGPEAIEMDPADKPRDDVMVFGEAGLPRQGNKLTEKYDLHSHSYYSDGKLSPVDVMTLAHENGVTTCALTDHDNINGLPEAQAKADALGIRLISGIELSCTWQKNELHMVGLNFDPNDAAFQAHLQIQQQCRLHRAEKIAERLAMLGFSNALAGARKHAGSQTIGRPHFAQHLVEIGAVKDLQKAFTKYLGNGKSAFVPVPWVGLMTAIKWVQDAGGVTVLAHPPRYKLTKGQLKRLLNAFKEGGGDAIEVVSGTHTQDEIAQLALHCQRLDLHASVGSDFHGFEHSRNRIGQLPDLPASCKPVWQLF
jgi:3',5'-nucleoside bisphosphate phosphatase